MCRIRTWSVATAELIFCYFFFPELTTTLCSSRNGEQGAIGTALRRVAAERYRGKGERCPESFTAHPKLVSMVVVMG